MRSSWRVAWILPLLAVFLCGCNVFDPLDTSLALRSDSHRIEEGDIALRSGDYSKALELFSPLYEKDKRLPEVVRGYGEALAGLGGFQLLPVMNAIQNEAFGNNQAPALFRTKKLLSDRAKVESAVQVLMANPLPVRTDRLARGLMRIPTVANLLTKKYDTNRNGKIDSDDNITYETNDTTYPTWTEIYRDLITGPSARGQTLEETFTDLIYGFDGRGASWTFTTPVKELRISGTFSDINKATIQAVGDLADRVSTANQYFNASPGSFAAAIAELDGPDNGV